MSFDAGRLPVHVGGDSARAMESAGFRSASYVRVLAQLARLARDRRAPILLEGESGTGKTWLAQAVHRCSPRAGGPFRHVVLSTLDDSLAGSELFGHVAGAFTDARQKRAGQFVDADGGTIFLDEIGKTSRIVQQKLLHAVEYQEVKPIGSDRAVRVDVRVVAATNLPLDELVSAGSFLPDLEARLITFRVRLPPLRERRADIPLLVAQSLHRHAGPCGYARPPVVADELMVALQRAPWPNNIRQLDATIHRLLIDAEGAPALSFEHCDDDLAYLREHAGQAAGKLDTDRIDNAIRRAGTLSGAARLLGVDRKTLRRHCERLRPAGDSVAIAPPDVDGATQVAACVERWGAPAPETAPRDSSLEDT